ncbi:hypothetical protein BREVNS_0531 [Brevinematales bacterium NS]|jgi:hypothetical protein|nr:hypothetical protein [Brevinematales bacterium]QJR21281.1 hypothetical protein BREVNS_0531 [Brevinematales bacterium NS]
MRKETIEKWIIKAESDLKIGKDEMMTENPATGRWFQKWSLTFTDFKAVFGEGD